MANYPSAKEVEFVKAPLSTTDVDSAYAGNADAALKVAEAVSQLRLLPLSSLLNCACSNCKY